VRLSLHSGKTLNTLPTAFARVGNEQSAFTLGRLRAGGDPTEPSWTGPRMSCAMTLS
jgi:hypothetical protein